MKRSNAQYLAVTLFLVFTIAITTACQPANSKGAEIVRESEQAGQVNKPILLSIIKQKAHDYPIPTQEECERILRLRKADVNGLLLQENGLYAIDKEGNYLSNQSIGFLNFNQEGKYTSGSDELDKLTWGIISEFDIQHKSREQLLKDAYDYVVDNVTYVGAMNHDLSVKDSDGENGWTVPLAIQALDAGYGNCYAYASAFTALARNLGYQAYSAGGIVGAAYQPHGWTIVTDDEGNILMSDPETEYVRKYKIKKDVDLFMKKPDEFGAQTGLSYTQQNKRKTD
jgi:hypothetical protein